MPKNGRRSKVDDGMRDQILAAITDGASRNTAARLVGISTSTIANEADRNQKFLDALKRAEAECEIFHIRRIKEGKAGWQSAAWFLERKWYKRWGLKTKVDVDSKSHSEVRIRKAVREKTANANP